VKSLSQLVFITYQHAEHDTV